MHIYMHPAPRGLISLKKEELTHCSSNSFTFVRIHKRKINGFEEKFVSPFFYLLDVYF